MIAGSGKRRLWNQAAAVGRQGAFSEPPTFIRCPKAPSPNLDPGRKIAGEPGTLVPLRSMLETETGFGERVPSHLGQSEVMDCDLAFILPLQIAQIDHDDIGVQNRQDVAFGDRLTFLHNKKFMYSC
jgi:hypothetical protein